MTGFIPEYSHYIPIVCDYDQFYNNKIYNWLCNNIGVENNEWKVCYSVCYYNIAYIHFKHLEDFVLYKIIWGEHTSEEHLNYLKQRHLVDI